MRDVRVGEAQRVAQVVAVERRKPSIRSDGAADRGGRRGRVRNQVAHKCLLSFLRGVGIRRGGGPQRTAAPSPPPERRGASWLRGGRRELCELGLGRLLVLDGADLLVRSEEHTSELQSLMRISYAVFC